MAEHEPIRRRWAQESPDEPAAKLLGQVLRPTLTPGQLARVRVRLDEAGAVPSASAAPRRGPLAPAVLALMLGILGGAAGYARLHPAAPARAPVGGAIAGPEAVRLELLGPGQLVAGSGEGPIVLRAGSLLVRTSDRPAIIEEAQARLTIPFHAIVEVVSAHGRPTLIAAYVGQAMVRWVGREKEQEVLLPAGHAATAAGPVPLPTGRLQRVLAWLARSDAAPSTMLPPLAVSVDAAGPRAIESPAAPGQPGSSPPLPSSSPAAPTPGSAATGGVPSPPGSPPLREPSARPRAPESRSTTADNLSLPRPPPRRLVGPAQNPRPGPAAGRPVAPVIPAAVPAPNRSEDDAVLKESELLGAAMTRLRLAHDPSGALGLLDSYHAQFPQGLLQPEAELLQVTALLALGKRREALALLEPRPLAADTPRGTELRVIRGELRAEAGRYPAARTDFDAAIGHVQGELLERALYARSRCRAQAGDAAGARSDLTDYLRRFPTGRFSTAARRELGIASPAATASKSLP